MTVPVTLLVAAAALAIIFAGIYLLCRWLDNYGFVDVAWSYAFAGLAAYYCLAVPGWPVRFRCGAPSSHRPIGPC